jgi:hypothetical protein
MTLSATRDTVQIGGPIVPSALVPFNFPVAAATTIYAGDVVCTDASGNAVPLSASTALKAWGVAQRTVDNSAGAAGAKTVDAMPGVHALTNGSGGDAITAAHVGRVAYGSADATANLTDGAGLRPALGTIHGLYGTQVKIAIGTPSLYDDPSSDSDPTAGDPVVVKRVRARNIVNGNIADLTAYTVAANGARNDNVLNVEGDIVLLIGQTTASQNGLYRVGAVAVGAAPLVRVSPLPVGAAIVVGEFDVVVAAGDVYSNTVWFNTAAVTIATTDPAFFPESVTQSVALVLGTTTVTNVPVLSATKSNVLMTRRIANTSTLTVGGYCASTGGANGVTAGKLGTASVIIEACVGAGTINNADISTLNITITNR